MSVPALSIRVGVASHAEAYASPTTNGTVESGRHGRTLIVSNRLPFAAIERDGEYWLRPSSGGLATALRRLHGRMNSLWIGAANLVDLAGAPPDVMNARFKAARLVAIALSRDEVSGFYRRYSNGVLWPVLHDLTPHVPDGSGWDTYRAVNRRFADVVVAEWSEGDTIWVHDYQLMLAPAMIRVRLPAAKIGFFLHTPFARAEAMTALEHWPELARGINGADVVGFQTVGDARRFALATGESITADNGARGVVEVSARRARIGAFPIAIDHAWFAERSRRPGVLNVCASIRAAATGPLFVGVDRLDYTKGIPERLLAFRRLLDFEPELRGRARFIQVAIPSRDGVEGYAELRQRIATIVAEINASLGTPRWTPIEFFVGSIDQSRLVALYRSADVMVVTPTRDGMNLVAKEFVASRTDGEGALVLSRYAGAAEELRGALNVEPADAGSIMEAYRRALRMSAAERRSRMRRLRAAVRSRDIFDWARAFLGAVTDSELAIGGPNE